MEQGGKAGMGLSSYFGLIGFGRATGVGLEEVGECALVVEVQAERNLADVLVRRAQQRAGFFKGEVVQVVVDAVAGEFSHYSAEIGGRDVQFVGIETDFLLISDDNRVFSYLNHVQCQCFAVLGSENNIAGAGTGGFVGFAYNTQYSLAGL